MREAEFVEGADKLIAVFGYWPSFHDAEVVRMTLDSGRRQDGVAPSVDAMIHTWESTAEVDATGYFVLRNHVIVHLRFREIDGLDLRGFNHQNVLSSLQFVDLRKQGPVRFQFEIQFHDNFGVHGVFRCRTIELLDVSPCDRNGTPTT